MSDCIADPEGRVFSGSVFYDPSGDYQLGKLIRVDTDESTHIVDEGFHIANGLAFSLDLAVPSRGVRLASKNIVAPSSAM